MEKVVHFPAVAQVKEPTATKVNNQYAADLKAIAGEIQNLANQYQADIKNVISDVNYLIIGADVLAIHGDQDS